MLPLPPLKTRELAAQHLCSRGIPTTEQTLADLAYQGRGPKYAVIHNRAVYAEADLEAWIAQQLARPVRHRGGRHRKSAEAAA